jgi:predicted nucleotidyltransferase
VATTRGEILEALTDFLRAQSDEFGLRRLGVFGSAARDQITDTSDVDVVVDLAEPNLLTLAAIMIRLEELLGRPVDVVHYKGLRNEYLKRRIDREAVYVG